MVKQLSTKDDKESLLLSEALSEEEDKSAGRAAIKEFVYCYAPHLSFQAQELLVEKIYFLVYIEPYGETSEVCFPLPEEY